MVHCSELAHTIGLGNITMLRHALLAFAIIFLSSPAYAQTVTAKDLDARIENQLFDVLKLGTDIYNRGSHESCYRLYQGCLMGLLGFMDHRPEHAEKIQKALRATDTITNAAERAHVLRDVIDELRTSIKVTHTTKPPTTTMPIAPAQNTITLWKRLGGEDILKPIVNDWINRALVNPRVNFTRRGTGHQWEANPENVAKVKAQFLAMLSANTGGPLKYTGKDMKSAHANMKITDPEFDAMMDDLTASMDKFFVSPFDRKDLIKAFADFRKDIVDSTVVLKPLWERLGGEATVTLVIDDFMKRAVANPKVNLNRKGAGKEWTATPDQQSALKKQMIAMISSVSGGPIKYAGKTLTEAHTGMKISEAEFEAFVADLKASLNQLKVNAIERDELLAIITKTRLQVIEK
jgi:hemoglobin